MQEPAEAKRTPLFREVFHQKLVEVRDACRGDGDIVKEMTGVGQLIEMTHGRIRTLEGQLRWADELLSAVEARPANRGIPDLRTVAMWRERWTKMKERQL